MLETKPNKTKIINCLGILILSGLKDVSASSKIFILDILYKDGISSLTTYATSLEYHVLN